MNKPFIKVGFLGLLVIGMGSVLLMVFPSKAPWMMDGFFTPVIAFEFIQSQSEVYRLFGLSGSLDQLSMTQTVTQAMISAMDLGNRLDYIFMVLYASFLFFFSFVCAKNTGKRYYYAAGILSIVILVADIMENIQLLRITAKIIHHNFTKELFFLHWFTWIKWGGITLVFLILTPYFFKGRTCSKVIAAIGITSFILCVLAYFNRSILNEFLSLSVSLMFLLMIIYSFIFKTEPEK
jgi:hypothetical protein